MTTEAIKALVGLRKKIISRIEVKAGGMIVHGRNTQLDQDDLITIVNAIEALKPMADVVMVPREPTEAMIEAAYKDMDIYWGYRADGRPGYPADVYRAMIAAAPPDSPAPVDDGERVERVARAIAKVIGDDDWEKADFFINTADDTIQTTQDLYRDLARAALAAINGENEHGK